MKHLPAIDGLRAIAVLAVVAYHAGMPVPAGFVGVDVFFVISGYLITRLLRDELQATDRVDFLAFYARRARRILPALVVVVLVTLALSLVLLPDPSDVAKSAAAAGGFVANLWFQAQTSDYWATSSEQMPLLHLWSLSVEEQFYLVWPVVLILARRKPVAALAALACVSLALAEWWLWKSPSVAFYTMPSRAWELALGGLVALHPMAWPKGSAWAGLAMVLAACFVPLGHFPGAGALPAVLGAGLLIGGVQAGQRVAPLTWKPVAYVGLISYSLYLWHWPLLALWRATHVGVTPLSVRLALVGGALVLAALSYRYVETPFRQVRGRKRVVAGGVLCLLALSGGAWGLAPSAPATAPVMLTCSGQGVMLRSRCVGSESVVAFWGDSYSRAWAPLTEAIAQRQGMHGTGFGRDNCPPTVGYSGEKRSEEAIRLCLAHNAETAAWIAQHHVDTLVLAARWPVYMPDAADALRQTIAQIAPHVRRIIVVGPTPEVVDDGIKCARAGERCAITLADYRARSAASWAALRSLRGVEIVDAGAWLCGTDCPGVRDGKPLYRDNRHVTYDTARAFAHAWLQ